MRKVDRAYLWELEFDDGTKVLQDSTPLVNPNDPPRSLGEVTKVRLLPQHTNLEVVEVDVPDGAWPVCHRLVARALGGDMQISRLTFRIGWKMNGVRNITNVDPQTGTVWETTDAET